ncbi:hypothetical protein C8R47DRAFT_1136289 [Mycena vitilis]|nr:hypothetical protein C8R47DRAFT_1136289 [Mycena vitilis]
MPPLPPVTDVYSHRANLDLYQPASVPSLPSQDNPDKLSAKWPSLYLTDNSKKRQSMADDPLAACYHHDIPYNAHSPPITITLATSLATGAREERPVQVWTATMEGSSDLLVARFYDPLYYDNACRDRFPYIERAVAIEHECYSRLKPYAGVYVPHFLGVFVAEIPGPAGPRHVYAVLLKHVHGVDVRNLMDGGVGGRTCTQHQAALVDGAARLLYLCFQQGVFPKDMKDANTIIQLPTKPSEEDFCPNSDCPFRNLIRIGFAFDAEHPEPPNHDYAPRLFLIDMELALFFSKQSWVGEADIQLCRTIALHEWTRNDYLCWVRDMEVETAFLPYAA